MVSFDKLQIVIEIILYDIILLCTSTYILILNQNNILYSSFKIYGERIICFPYYIGIITLAMAHAFTYFIFRF